MLLTLGRRIFLTWHTEPLQTSPWTWRILMFFATYWDSSHSTRTSFFRVDTNPVNGSASLRVAHWQVDSITKHDWELSHYIGVGLDKLRQYINEGRKTCIYALSMSKFFPCWAWHQYWHFPVRIIVVNPSIKLEWLEEHWEAEDVGNAIEWMLQPQAVRVFFPV